MSTAYIYILRNAVGESCAVLWLYRFLPLSFLALQEKKIRRKKTKCKKKKCHGRFQHAGAFARERTAIIVFCVLRTFASTVLFAQFPLCRTLVLVSIVLRYTNNHRHPYMDSTTVLSDMLFPGGTPLSHGLGVLLGTPGQLHPECILLL